ncbi:MAG: rRNA pseudouridine synthase [Oscillospiraceae bacterium]|nr:rRNA pseudouridine synthase [Oscillospiraceae bacterium]
MADIRIQKLLADAGVCSRRKAEELISQGRVTCNGNVVGIGDKASVKDRLEVDGKMVRQVRNRKFVYIMLNKPRGYVTTTSDELERKCVMDLLDGVEERVFPVGRLDRNSEGLLLLTNDGNFANSITHPSKHISKTYRVTTHPRATGQQLIEMSKPIVIDGRQTEPASVVVKTQEENRTVMLVTIHEGRNRQIRRLCENAGLEVARLRRISIGPLKLGMLKPGAYRELTAEELRAIRTAIGGKQ